MRSNNLLTYILYGLLALIITIAGYYTCQRQKEKQMKQEQDEAELQQTLRDMGYAKADTSASAGSTFEPGDGSTTNKDGIEQEPAKPGTTTSTTTGTTAGATKTSDKTKDPVPATTPKTTPPPAPKTSPSTVPSSVKGPGTGRWAVRAGTFAYMEGARLRLEQVIKLGYTSAEISKTSSGKAAVVVFRSNDKNAATQVAEKLKAKGIDAAVFAR